MLQARRKFLSKGYYVPLVKALCSIIQSHKTSQDLTFYDAGCGEGYYLHQITENIFDGVKRIVGFGSDIAKIAIQMAAKSYSQLEFCVASSYHLPVEEHSIDVVLQIFAPASHSEIVRILKPGGLLLKVNPGANHLNEFKACVYEQVVEHILPVQDINLLKQLDRQAVQFGMTFAEPEDVLDLLKMTPFYWAASEQAQQAILALQHVTADFDIQILRKDDER